MPWIIRPHPWSALAECGTVGIELWSLVTDTAERWRTPRQVLSFLRRSEAVPARLRLLQDGRVLAERFGRNLDVQVERQGSYRVEAWLAGSGRKRPWIVSNPIYLR
ncbi:MAG TPA: hypothetical protein VJU80_13795 [Solirubrobacteraceae bacterium]|nr:hypothetical protein [Solirubrobacteraceae bacterium]